MMLTLIILATIVMQNSDSIVVPDNLERGERAGGGGEGKVGRGIERGRGQERRGKEVGRGGEGDGAKEKGEGERDGAKKLRISMNLGMQEEEGGRLA